MRVSTGGVGGLYGDLAKPHVSNPIESNPIPSHSVLSSH